MSSVLLIDGENFRKKASAVLERHDIADVLWSNFDVSGLFATVLGDDPTRKTYYAAKLEFNPESPEKSRKLIEQQRVLKTKLEGQGYIFQMAGRVRCQDGRCPAGHIFKVFKEKGVDVKIGVDLTVCACDKAFEKVFLCCSDSDLQPAVKEARSRGQEVVYVGFEDGPNIGLMHTCSRTILIRSAEVIAKYPIRPLV